jgi:hypothetical protein
MNTGKEKVIMAEAKKKSRAKGKSKLKLSELQKELQNRWISLEEEKDERKEEYREDFLNLFYTNINEETREDVPEPEDIDQMRVFFGYDSVIDELVLEGVSVYKNVGGPWADVHNDRYLQSRYLFVGIGDLDEEDIGDVEKYTKKPTIPFFTKLLEAKNSQLRKELRNAYKYDKDGIPMVDIHVINRPLLFIHLFNIWLQYHTPEYLERKYDLAKPLPATFPRILRTIDDVLHRYSSSGLSIVCLRKKYIDGINLILSIDEDDEDDDEDYRVAIIDERRRLSWIGITRFIRMADKFDKTIFIDTPLAFEGREEAFQQIARIKELLNNEKKREELSKHHKEGTAAEFAAVIRAEGFRREKVKRYIKSNKKEEKDEWEDKWKRLCSKTNPREEDVDSLLEIAQELDINTKSRDAKYICRLIEKQVEVEFGERARMREIREENEKEIEEYRVKSPRKSRSPSPSRKGKEKV